MLSLHQTLQIYGNTCKPSDKQIQCTETGSLRHKHSGEDGDGTSSDDFKHILQIHSVKVVQNKKKTEVTFTIMYKLLHTMPLPILIVEISFKKKTILFNLKTKTKFLKNNTRTRNHFKMVGLTVITAV